MVVHENERKESASTVQFVSGYIQSYKDAQQFFSQPRPPDNVVCWQPLGTNEIKLNFDASITRHPPSAGLGIVARNDMGRVIARSRKRVQYVQDPELAESLATQLAVKLALSLQLQQVCLEGDCSNLIKNLQSSSPCLADSGTVIDDILALISSFSCVRFSFVPILGNVLAHLLSRNFSVDDEGGNVLPSDI